MLTRNQKFAVAVFEKVEVHKSKDKNDKDKYGTMAKKLPVLIRTAGLAQAITFLQAKSKKDSEKMNLRLFEDLSAVVAAQMNFDKSAFAEECRKAKLNDYLQLTQNTLAALLWFKRFSVSVLEVPENVNQE